jgi:hypothetical protein
MRDLIATYKRQALKQNIESTLRKCFIVCPPISKLRPWLWLPSNACNVHISLALSHLEWKRGNIHFLWWHRVLPSKEYHKQTTTINQSFEQTPKSDVQSRIYRVKYVLANPTLRTCLRQWLPSPLCSTCGCFWLRYIQRSESTKMHHYSILAVFNILIADWHHTLTQQQKPSHSTRLLESTTELSHLW